MQVEELRAIVAANVRLFAFRKHIPITTLADVAGISRSALFVLLDGETGGSLKVVAMLAEALDVRPCELLDEQTVQSAKRRPRKRRARSRK